LRRWIGGRVITAASTTTDAPVERLVGSRVEEVEARAKHLLVRCSGDLTLHTHMKMTGSWHVYTRGDEWRRSRRQARLVIECGDRVAVCFNAPVIELIEAASEAVHPGLVNLGPDVMRPPVDTAEVARRAAAQPRDRAIADVILDQSVVGGIGNIWRSEALFATRTSPTTPVGELSAADIGTIVNAASRLMTAPRRVISMYKRTGRPCPRCGARIRSARFENGRYVYWCPRCQAGAAS
jgi:endonuclease-8